MTIATRTPAVRVIDRIHRFAANGWANTAPTRRTCLADLTKTVLFVADLAAKGSRSDGPCLLRSLLLFWLLKVRGDELNQLGSAFTSIK